ncbi:uncharacterized protein LOC135391825 [Ornithodoros turicata]|uniref:uncharacterized protein LOC135391825 n=1 Tax=Ornithodoros turicata TaxID=34597 RepID=UPI0031389D33
MDNLERLKKMRASSRATVTRIINDLKTLIATSPHDPAQLTAKLTFLETKASTLTQLNQEIQALIDEASLEAECEACDQYSGSIITISVQAREALNTALGVTRLASAQVGGAPQPSSATSQGVGPPADGIKLPKLRIDSFSGVLFQWQGFWDQFRVSIRENPRLSNVNKFKYLISLVTGPAARAIEGLSLRDENYVTAVDILKTRFGKTELLVSDHLDSLFDLPPVKSIDDVRSLRKFHEAATVRNRHLQSLGVSRSKYSITILRTILRKIPPPLELEYYRTDVNRTDSATSSAAMSTADDLSSLLDFLEIEIEFRERVRRPTASSKEDTADCRKTPLYPPAASLAARATEAVCVLCKSNEHSLAACTAPLSAADKSSLLRREGRCFLCGKRSHLSKDCRVCYRLRCQNCNRRHLTQLCVEGLSASSSNVAVTPDIVTTSPAASSSAAVVQDIVTTMSSAPQAPKVQPEREILLQTAKIWVQCENGQRRLVRVLLDGGSQRSFIRKDISAKIGCTALRTEDLHIHTLGNVAPSRIT